MKCFKAVRAGVVRWLLAGVVVFLLARAMAQSDGARIVELLSQAGPQIFIALIPFAVTAAVDACSLQWILRLLGRRVPLAKLYGLRLTSEAIALSLPGGALVAESANPVLLNKQTGCSIPEGVAAYAIRKCWMGFAQGLCLFLGLGVGLGALRGLSSAIVGSKALPWIVGAAGLFLIVMFTAMTAALLGAGPARRVLHQLETSKIAVVRNWAASRARGFHELDAHLDGVRSAPLAAKWVAVLGFVLAWVMESVETLVLLRLLGATVSLRDVLAFEPTLGLLRSFAFFSPGGLGVQDAGYLTWLGSLGSADAVSLAAAFVVLKRGKEIFWAIVGYALLGAQSLRDRLVAPQSA